jgi:uncharacterized protein
MPLRLAGVKRRRQRLLPCAPMTSRFVRYELRTTDVNAATSFYAAVLGRRDLTIRALPDAARNRGAPAHWLGYLSTADQGGAIAALQRWTEHGAMPIGARVGNGAVVRDPGGATLALLDSAAIEDVGVVFHALHTPNAERAAQRYAELFGWVLTETRQPFQHFAFEAGGPDAGVITDIAGRPEVHPHWMFFFAPASFEAALACVREHGGKVIGPIALPDGRRVAACDDPQGAAFGLIEP